MPDQFALIRWNDISQAIAQAQDINDLNRLRLKLEMLRIPAKQGKQDWRIRCQEGPNQALRFDPASIR